MILNVIFAWLQFYVVSVQKYTLFGLQFYVISVKKYTLFGF